MDIKEEYLAIMRAEISITGEKLDPHRITEILDMEPTQVITNKDCAIWLWQTEPIGCITTETPLMNLAEVFIPKAELIAKLCDELNPEIHIKVYAEFLGGELSDPILGLSAANIAFANALKADIEIIVENWPDILEDDEF